MNRKILTFSLLLMPLLVPLRAAALQFCQEAANEEDCKTLVRKGLKVPHLAKELKGEEAIQAIKDLAQATTDGAARDLLLKVAPEIAALPGASAAFEDFLARLRIGVSTENLDNKQALAVDFTDFLGLPTKSGYKLQAVARDPTLFEELSKKLSAENREKRTKGLGDFDNLLVTFSYSPTTSHLGTNLEANQILIDELFGEFLGQNEGLATAATQAKLARESLSDGISRDFPDALSEQTGLVTFAKITDPNRQLAFREAVELAEIAEAKRLAALSKILTAGGFFKVADLVANQPQLVLKATRSVRDQLVGPEETTLKASWEMGFINMNSLRRALARCKPDEVADCYTRFVEDRKTQLAKNANRLTFSFDWTRRQDYDVAIDGASVDAPGRNRWCASTTLGRNLRLDQEGNAITRIDLTGSWQDWSDDPMHQDRGMANLSFTQKVNDDFSLVLGAVWASKPEFRGQVDKEVSARFGLTYRFLDKNGKEIVKDKG